MIPQSAISIYADGIANAILCKDVKVKTAKVVRDTFPSSTQEVNVIALWDTGATSSCISNKLADKLGLTLLSFTKVKNAGGTHEARVFKIDLDIMGRMNVENWNVVEFIKEDDPFDIILGMDLIALGDMSITNAQGKTTFSFQAPPADVHIDFVKDINERNAKMAYQANAVANLKTFKKKHRHKH